MSQGVFTPELRFTWVKGQVTDTPDVGYVSCGSGTAYCLPVTGADRLDKLAEIFYRVVDARLSGGASVTAFDTTFELVVAPSPPPEDRYTLPPIDPLVSEYVTVQRSYADKQDPPQNVTNEREMWGIQLSVPELALYTRSTRPQTHGIVTGYTHYAESFFTGSAPPIAEYAPYGVILDEVGEDVFAYPAIIEVAFGGDVAVTGDGNPFNLMNEIWVEFGVAVGTWDSTGVQGEGVLIIDLNTLHEGNPNEDVVGQFRVNLAEGRFLECDLISSNASFYSYTVDLSVDATEWWPYAKDSPAVPVWNADTGARL